jgi:hypothetical protein
MFWDDLVRRWRREASGLDPRLLRAAAGQVAALPAPRQRRRSPVRWLLLIALGVALLVLLVQTGHAQAAALVLAAG